MSKGGVLFGLCIDIFCIEVGNDINILIVDLWVIDLAI